MARAWRGMALAILLAAPATARAAEPIGRPPPRAALEQEVWAGISYGDALAGLAVLGGGGVAVAWLTGSTIAAFGVAAAAAISFVVYDPGPPPPVTTSAEALPELAPGGKD